jgi:hypothetical protein
MRLTTSSSPLEKNMPLLVRILRGGRPTTRLGQRSQPTGQVTRCRHTYALAIDAFARRVVNDGRALKSGRRLRRNLSLLCCHIQERSRTFCFRCSHSSSVRKLWYSHARGRQPSCSTNGSARDLEGWLTEKYVTPRLPAGLSGHCNARVCLCPCSVLAGANEAWRCGQQECKDKQAGRRVSSRPSLHAGWRCMCT